MAIIKGAWNDLLRPGLMEVWEEAYETSKRRTGIEETQMGRPARRRLEDTPHAEDDWPPKDWP